jgi:hypothetical protein
MNEAVKMPRPCTYRFAFEMVSNAVSARNRHVKYPPGAVRDIALECTGAISEDMFVDKCVAAMERIESSFKTNPSWDGSVA